MTVVVTLSHMVSRTRRWSHAVTRLFALHPVPHHVLAGSLGRDITTSFLTHTPDEARAVTSPDYPSLILPPVWPSCPGMP